MNLGRILEGITVTKMFQTLYGQMVTTHDVEVKAIQYDSRRVTRDDLFVAIKGTETDGHTYIQSAVHSGAKVVILEDDSALPDAFFMHSGVVKVVVSDSRKALAIASANFYGNPAAGMKLVGVTGTNGKTTTTHLVKSILEAHGERVGLIGTIAHTIGDTVVPASHTTPESLDLQQLLAEMRGRGCGSVVMEVSSHSLVLDRVYGIHFAAGVFTNLTQDHLDFHGTMDEYFKAKKKMFDELPATSHAVTNLDDPAGKQIIGSTAATPLTYSVAGKANVTASAISISVKGTRLSISHGGVTRTLESPLTGRFNVHNILAAYATGVALDIPDAEISKGIQRVAPVRGRFEQIVTPQGWTAIIDYAHTPDALDNCLRTIQDIMGEKGKIITVFGCGGNRDTSKRPRMGAIASRMSAVTIVTSDNPRREEPGSIINDILGGVVEGADVRSEPDRHAAIRMGLAMARPGDIVLIAGKGHEDYQVIGDTRIHFDDREEVERFLKDVQ